VFLAGNAGIMPAPNWRNYAPPPLPCPWLRYDHPEIQLLPASLPGSNDSAASATPLKISHHRHSWQDDG
jgi:hypothetical protein